MKKLSELTLTDLVALQTYHRWCMELNTAMIPKVLDETTARMNLIDKAIKNKINQIDFNL